MSLLTKKYVGRLEDGNYLGTITRVVEKTTGTKEYVDLTIKVGTAEFTFALFEVPFSWAITSLMNQYYRGQELEAGQVLADLIASETIIPFKLYTDNYAGKSFQRISFSQDVEEAEESNEPAEDAGDLEFN